MSARISVIVPIYNVATYLRRCVDSILQQTYSNLEIFLIDDGSTDESGVICDELSAKDARIVVIHQKNGGLSAARNAGLDHATGEWIAFLDSDDWIEPQMYEVLERIAGRYDADIASCLSRNVSVDGLVPPVKDTLEELVLDSDGMIGGLLSQKAVRFEVWNKLFRRSTIGDLRFKLRQVSEDVYFDRVLFLKSNRMIHINQTLHNYLILRPCNTNSSFKAQRLCVFPEFDALIADLKARQKPELANMVSCIAMNFSVAISAEAIRTKQDASMKKQLRSLYRRYRREAGNCHYVNRKVTFFFDIHPMLYYAASTIKHAFIGESR